MSGVVFVEYSVDAGDDDDDDAKKKRWWWWCFRMWVSSS